MPAKQKTYKEAFEELESILSDLESNTLDVDHLTLHIQKASELITFCKSKLFETEKEIEKIIQDMEEEK